MPRTPPYCCKLLHGGDCSRLSCSGQASHLSEYRHRAQSYHHLSSPLCSSSFPPSLFFQGLMLHFECNGLLHWTPKPHSPFTFFSPLHFAAAISIGRNKPTAAWSSTSVQNDNSDDFFFQRGSLTDRSIICRALILNTSTVQTAGRDSTGLFCSQLPCRSGIPLRDSPAVALEQRGWDVLTRMSTGGLPPSSAAVLTLPS